VLCVDCCKGSRALRLGKDGDGAAQGSQRREEGFEGSHPAAGAPRARWRTRARLSWVQPHDEEVAKRLKNRADDLDEFRVLIEIAKLEKAGKPKKGRRLLVALLAKDALRD